MTLHSGVKATVRFEFQRSFTLGRATAFAVLSLFPPAITLISTQTPATVMFWLPVALTTFVVCLLSNLLWATPTVYNELEGRTWIFSTSRPQGRLTMLLGKYVVSVIWTLAVCVTALTLSCMVLKVSYPHLDVIKIYAVLGLILVLATLGYAATFTLIGTIFHRKSMMVAIAYCLVSEVVMASIPALIGQLTIRSHLTHLLAYTLLPQDILGEAEVRQQVGDENLVVHGVAVIVIGGVALAVASAIIRYREYITADET